MTSSVEIACSGPAVSLAGRLTAANAGRCAAALRSALAASRNVTVSFGPVEAADLTLLQVLCAAHRTAVDAGGTLALGGPVPGALVELAARAGAERCLEGPGGCILRALRAAAAQGG